MASANRAAAVLIENNYATCAAGSQCIRATALHEIAIDESIETFYRKQSAFRIISVRHREMSAKLSSHVILQQRPAGLLQK